MATVHDAVVSLAAGVGAVVTLGGGLWWLVWPRVKDRLEEVARGVRAVEKQTASDAPDTLSRHARVAAGAVSEIPELRAQLQHIADRVAEGDAWRESTDRRLTALEESLIALLSKELRERLQE